jgi:hypothetical protein
VASAGSENYRDDFGEISYEGSDGSLDWSDPWVESEGNGPGNGQITVNDYGNCSNNKCLRMVGGLLAQLSISRKADLTGFLVAGLSFDLEIDPAFLSTATLAVQVRGNGSGWKTLKTYPLLLNDGSFEESFDVSSYIGADFELLFSLNNVLGGDDVYIDRVEIEGSVTPPSSTTSTSTITVPTITVPTISVTTTSTTSAPDTSTTQPRVTTTTFRPSTTQTEDPSSSAGEGATTTTTTNPTASADLPIPPGAGGLRDPGVGLLADYRPGMMGDLDLDGVEVLGAEISAEFTIASPGQRSRQAKLEVGVRLAQVSGPSVTGEPGPCRVASEIEESP